MRKIPFDPSLSADQQVTFTGAESPCVLRFVWNVYSSAWFVTVGDDIQPRKIVPNFPLLFSMSSRSPIKGDFIAVKATTGAPETIGYDDLGSTWLFAYMSAAEREAWSIANGLG